MQSSYTLREAKARLSHLLDLAAAGEEIEIVRKGGKRDRFRIVRVGGDGALRKPGALSGRIRIADDFDAEVAGLTRDFDQPL